MYYTIYSGEIRFSKMNHINFMYSHYPTYRPTLEYIQIHMLKRVFVFNFLTSVT